jgi:hypothetical protein
MRISALVVVLLVGLVSVSVAGDGMRQNLSSQPALDSFNSGLLSPSSIANVDQPYSRSDSTRDGNVTCFTMHTFLVKRESPRSDLTEPAGEATCLSGPRYSVRKVEEPDKAPPR